MLFINDIQHVLRYACTNWNSYRQYHSILHTLNMILVKPVENDFRDSHLHNLNSLLTISFCTTPTQLESHYIRANGFQRFTLLNLKSLLTISLYTTLNLILATFVRLYCRDLHLQNLYLYGKVTCFTPLSTPWFPLHSQNMISLACDSYCAWIFPYKYIFRTYIRV